MYGDIARQLSLKEKPPMGYATLQKPNTNKILVLRDIMRVLMDFDNT